MSRINLFLLGSLLTFCLTTPNKSYCSLRSQQRKEKVFV